MRKPLALVTLSLALACAQVQTALAVEATAEHLEGVTYSIGNGFTGGSHPEGSHFHSINLDELPAGNPPIILPGAAEVGGFFGDEEIRAVSEFIVGDVVVEEAVLRFEALDLFLEGITAEASGIDGLFGQGPYEGSIDVFAYVADGVESIGDYQVETLGEFPILTFEVNDDLVLGGDSFSVDVTSLYNDRVAVGEDLGIRLQMSVADADAGAITFGNFRIDLEPVAVPEPTSGLLLTMSILGCLALRRKR